MMMHISAQEANADDTAIRIKAHNEAQKRVAAIHVYRASVGICNPV